MDHIKLEWQVAKEFQQDYIENEEVYSLVARMTTLQVLLSIACITGSKIEQMDVETAFLNGKIKSEVYIYPPEIKLNKLKQNQIKYGQKITLQIKGEYKRLV